MKKLTILEWIIGLLTLAGCIVTIASCSCSPTVNPPEIKVDMHMEPPKVEVNMPEQTQPTEVHIHPRPRRTPRERRQDRRNDLNNKGESE